MTNKEKFGIFSSTEIRSLKGYIDSLEILKKNYDDFLEKRLPVVIEEAKEEINKDLNSRVKTQEELDEAMPDLWAKLQAIGDYYGKSIIISKALYINYVIVVAFSLYEKAIKSIFKYSGKFTKSELRNCYKREMTKKYLKDKFNIEYEHLKDSEGVEEFRVLSNGMKHDLANIDFDSALNDQFVDFLRLKDAPVNLLEDLVDKIEVTP
jgi:hypothetical protein